MPQRTMLALAAAITVFTLVVAGALAGQLDGGGSPTGAAASDPVTLAPEPSAAASVAERESAYAAARTVSAEQAAQIARSYRGGGAVREVERERERGDEVYEVKFSDGAEVYVEAATGQVVYAQLGGDRQRDGERLARP